MHTAETGFNLILALLQYHLKCLKAHIYFVYRRYASGRL